MCQIATPNQTFVVDAAKVDLSFLEPFLRSWKWLKVIQNAKFENEFFKYKYGFNIVNIWDTYLAERILTPDARPNTLGLGAISVKYLAIEMEKSTRKTFIGKRGARFTDTQLAYAAKDAEVLIPIYEQQLLLVKEHNLLPITQMEFDIVPVISDMELTGVPVDTALWNEKIHKYEELHESSRLKMHEFIFDTHKLDEQLGMFTREAINLNSPKQLKEAFAKIGLKVDTTNEREISLVSHPAAQELLKYREYQKILSAYGRSFLDKIHPFTNRIHADFQQIGTETGRFSCREPNLQQMPEEFRACITHPDYMIVGADYSQIELRILAELSGDRAFIEAFTSGEDLHKSTASMMFSISSDSVSKEQRFIAKTINFGISYGMGPGKLMDILNAEASKNNTAKYAFPQVLDLIQRYHRTYSKVSEWLISAGNLAYIRGYSETMLGRKRFYNKPNQTSLPLEDFKNQVAAIKRKGANSPIQGTNADITKIAMRWLYSDLQDSGLKANIVLQVHDEIAVLARKEHAQAVKFIVEESMTRAGQEVLKTVPVKVESYISDVWKK